MVVVGVLAAGVVLSGCPQPPAPEREKPAGKPKPKPPSEKLEKPTQPPEEPPTKPQPKPELGPQPGRSVDTKPSSYAPAEHLVDQVAEYIEELEDAVESQEVYEESRDEIARDSNTLIVIALALGLHDQDNKYKAAAGELIQAAQDLAAANDYASASKGVAAIKAAAAKSSPATELKWERVASLPELMKEVPLVNSSLGRCRRRIERRAEAAQGYAAVLAVIGQGSIPNAGDTDKPDEAEKWREFCIDMRNAAAAVGAAYQARDEQAVIEATGRLQQSCDDCHEVFQPEELQK